MADRSTLLRAAGWLFTLAVTAFMLIDVSVDLRELTWAVDANARLGIPANVVFAVGLTGLFATLLYVFPPTALIGVILLTGFLGGAVMTHVRVNGSAWDIGENLAIGVAAWGAIWLRDPRLRRLMPLRRRVD